jgi:apoptosis-inducing factor 3
MLLGAAGFSYSAYRTGFMQNSMQGFSFSTVASAEGALKEVEIDFADSLGEGEMKELKVGAGDEDKVLVARYQGKIHSVGNYCSHFGAPLSTGLLFDDKVLCPWHGAGFNIVTGEIDSAPGLDGIPKFEVIERGGKYFVLVPEKLPRKESAPLTKRDPSNKTHYVVVGGGPAGLNCAETLRQSGFTGQVTLISAEDILPYDRTLLTKVLPVGDGSKFGLRSGEYLNSCDVEYKLGAKVTGVDPKAKTVTLADGSVVHYDKLCIATGGDARLPKVQGAQLENVHVLRSYQDQAAIKAKAAGSKSVAVIGASFIGSESASSLKMKYKDEMQVHLISNDEFPL